MDPAEPSWKFAACREYADTDGSAVSSDESVMANLLRLLLAILLPPVGVFFTVGFGGQFWLNILLTILGYIPGIVHAVWIIARQSR
jgi:uncharacterized membrane protein YqaE (UPF0057 family)